MKQTILAIFAHPDDESFGPGGTLALLAKEHTVVLVSVTHGEACSLFGKQTKETIQETRKKEMLDAAKVLGISDVRILSHPDGGITNAHMQTVTKELKEISNEINPSALVTFEPHGFSGHLDHIAVTSAVTNLYRTTEEIQSIHYFAINTKQRTFLQDYFVYFPSGYPLHQLNTIVHVGEAWQKKMTAIDAYASQMNDKVFWEPMLSGYDKHEHFISEYKSGSLHPFQILLAEKHLLKTEPSLTRW